MRPDRPRYARALLLLAAAAPAALAQPQQGEQPDPALRAYLSANGMLARGMNDLAAAEYRTFLDEQPTNDRAPHARYGLAVALFRQKNYGESSTHLAGLGELKGFEFAAESAFLQAQCAIAADKPADAGAPLQLLLKRHAAHELADDAAALLAESQYRAGNYAESIAAAGALAKLAKDSPLRDRAEYFAALSQIKSGDERAAATRLAELAGAWPKSPLAEQAALLAAQCAHRTGDAAAAKRSYESLLSPEGGTLTADALLGLAALEHAAKELDAAQQHLDKLLADFPKASQAGPALLQRARVLFDKQDYDAARADLSRYAKTTGADQAQYAFWTAKCHLRAGKPTQAAKLLASALDDLAAESDLRPSMLYDLALAQLESGREDDAIAALTRFRADFADHALAPEATEALATILHRKGDYAASQQVCSDFRAKFTKHSALPRIDLLTAENAFLADDLPAAEKGYTGFLAAHAKDPGCALANFRLGCIHFRTDLHAKAEPLLTHSAALADNDPIYRPALLYLGDIAFQAKRWADADAHLSRYLAFADVPAADDALLKRGIALHNLTQHEKSAEILQRLIAEHPKSAHRALATFELARTLLALNRTDEAQQHLRSLAEGKDPSIAALASNQLASLAIARGDTKASADLFRAAAESGDERAAPDALHGLASVLLSSGDNEGALRAFDQLIDTYPKHPRLAEARAQRALARARHTPDEQSIAELAAALKAKDPIAPELRDALRYEQATCLRKLDRAADARKTLRELADSASMPALRIHAALDIARADLEASEPARAAETLRSISSLLSQQGIDPELREHAEYQLAAAEFRQEHAKEAADLFTAFLKAHPESKLAPSASLLAAESLIRQNQHARAIEHLKTALTAELPEPDQQSALLRLGECHAAAQQWSDSEQSFTIFLDRFTASDLWFQARFGKGWALENQGRHADAMTEYAKVTANHQGPTAARAQFQIGECLFAQGKHEDAAREFLKVDILYAYPEWSAAALYEAGRCFEAMNQPEKAREQYQQVREKHAQTQWAGLAAKRLSAVTK
jgi:TolA-binding protein